MTITAPLQEPMLCFMSDADLGNITIEDNNDRSNKTQDDTITLGQQVISSSFSLAISPAEIQTSINFAYSRIDWTSADGETISDDLLTGTSP
ncbi:hypothetical protein KDN34_02710 [Shewanella yunxiaonensis]|uniref:Haemolysin-type calcium binding-related domain-containing protein n=1 Tax=Shewanella yunxiaonensis TaxID=2829809 RepID=A0ABX7YVN0_9GAMM|nr:hypothetical protein [Shewanella yunxiaonensis]QUN06395.1 hypothetical protein KDN34_02710 [Shewanella yunxiaonensis]